MRKRGHMVLRILSAVLLPAGLLSCNRISVFSSETDSATVAVDLSLSLGSAVQTKANVVTISEMDEDSPVFRGMEGVFMVPFENVAPIEEDSHPLSYSLVLPPIAGGSVSSAYNSESDTYASGLVGTINAHLYNSSDANLPLKTSSVLIYGRAATAPVEEGKTDADLKHLNGSLIVSGIGLPTAASLRFSPEAMLQDTPTESEDIIDALNDVVFGPGEDVTDTRLKFFSVDAYYAVSPEDPDHWKDDEVTEYKASMPWNGDIGDVVLRQCYEKMVQDGSLMFGSGANVEALITSLYQTLCQYTITQTNSPSFELEKGGKVYELRKKDEDGSYVKLSFADMYIGVREMVKERIETCNMLVVDGNNVSFKDPSVSAYPESLGLPSGAAVVRWTPTGYVVPQEDGMDGLAPISHFCYPPSLYYYSNTNIKTSDTESVRLAYTSTDNNANNTWSNVLSRYTNGGTVTGNTRSVVLTSPLNFAVGMFKFSVKAAEDKLLDHSKLIMVPVTENSFPVTGIIIGGQYAQRFDFTPDYTPTATQYFLYDNLVSGLSKNPGTENGAEATPICLTTEASDYFRVLSLQTPDDKEVYFALELKNNSSVSFYGVEGLILPGHRFYLLGKLEVYPEGDERRTADSVVVKDCFTTVNCVIPSFKNAHNAIPDLGVPQLGLGVIANLNWTLSSPTTVLFE